MLMKVASMGPGMLHGRRHTVVIDGTLVDDTGWRFHCALPANLRRAVTPLYWAAAFIACLWPAFANDNAFPRWRRDSAAQRRYANPQTGEICIMLPNGITCWSALRVRDALLADIGPSVVRQLSVVRSVAISRKLSIIEPYSYYGPVYSWYTADSVAAFRYCSAPDAPLPWVWYDTVCLTWSKSNRLFLLTTWLAPNPESLNTELQSLFQYAE